MKQITIWITNLEAGKRTVAILILGITALFGLFTRSEMLRDKERLQCEKNEQFYNEQLIKRTDEFNIMYNQLIIKYALKMEDELRDQLYKSDSIHNKTEKLIEKNGKLIKTLNRN